MELFYIWLDLLWKHQIVTVIVTLLKALFLLFLSSFTAFLISGFGVQTMSEQCISSVLAAAIFLYL